MCLIRATVIHRFRRSSESQAALSSVNDWLKPAAGACTLDFPVKVGDQCSSNPRPPFAISDSSADSSGTAKPMPFPPKTGQS